jgi:hypothetical protein
MLRALKSIIGKSQLSFGEIEKVSGIFPHSDRHTPKHDQSHTKHYFLVRRNIFPCPEHLFSQPTINNHVLTNCFISEYIFPHLQNIDSSAQQFVIMPSVIQCWPRKYLFFPQDFLAPSILGMPVCRDCRNDALLHTSAPEVADEPDPNRIIPITKFI